jgi:hypothetical protein
LGCAGWLPELWGKRLGGPLSQAFIAIEQEPYRQAWNDLFCVQEEEEEEEEVLLVKQILL